MNSESKPLVSVRLMVYNNEPFIREAVESILMQKTDFKVEIVVGDDFSTDNTLEIIRSYKSTERINIRILDRPIGGEYWFKRKNKNASVRTNFIDIVENCNGKYIALFDGDDYWTDPLKLQKQVGFMEANPKCGICFHEAKVLWENENSPKSIQLNSQFPWNKMNPKKDIYTIVDVFNGPFMATASVVFRQKDLTLIPKWFSNTLSGDITLYALVLGDNKIKFINEVMSVYRKHPASITRCHTENQIIFNRIETLININKHYQSYYSKNIKIAINDYLNGIKLNGYKEFLTVLKLYLLTGLVDTKTFKRVTKKYFASKLKK